MLTRTDEILARSQLATTIPEGCEDTDGKRAHEALWAVQAAVAIRAIALNGLPVSIDYQINR